MTKSKTLSAKILTKSGKVKIPRRKKYESIRQELLMETGIKIPSYKKFRNKVKKEENR